MTLDPDTRSDLIRVAHMLADAARVETLSMFRSDQIATDDKGGGLGFDPVTQADRAAEGVMREILARERPDDGILGEEFGVKSGTSGLTWVLDPIDGTRGFISGAPTWGVLIAVSDITGPIYGIIDQPYIGERFEGGLGRAETTGPQGVSPLCVRQGGALSSATLLSTFPEVGSKLERRAFEAVAEQVQLTRFGMDCYGYAMLARGQVDLVIEAGLQSYDIHAPIAVIRAAGGIVTNWQGGAPHHGGRVIAAGCRDMHTLALSIIRDVTGD